MGALEPVLTLRQCFGTEAMNPFRLPASQMSVRRAITALAPPLLLIACAHARAAAPVSPAPFPNAAVFVGENERTLYGDDPVARTRARIGETQELLRRHCESHGRYPQTLAPALPTPRSEWTSVYDFDAWDRPLLYVGGPHEYRLQSAGADGRFDTADDVIGTATSLQVAAPTVTAVAQPNPCAPRSRRE
jgi:hypothetical protein